MGRLFPGCSGLLLSPGDVAGLKAFRPLHQIVLDCLTFVQSAIAAFLNGGEMYEHIFSRGALDKTISLRAIEPFHRTFFTITHSQLLSSLSLGLFIPIPEG